MADLLTFPDRTKRSDLSYLEKATAVRIELGSLQVSKKLPQGTVKTDTGTDETTGEETSTDPKRIGASKRLLRCTEAAAIQREQSGLRSWVREKTVPSPFGDGVYLVPNVLLGEVDAKLVVTQANVRRLGEALIQAYDGIIAKEREALGPQFNLSDYDPPSVIRERLRVEWSYVVFGVPQNLPGNLYSREAGKAQAKLAEAVDSIQQVLRAEMAELVNHASEMLTAKGADGKLKMFKNTLTENIKDFLNVFTARNITNDRELEAICNQARMLLDGVKPENLRKSSIMRSQMAEGFAGIRAKLATMTVTAGSRKITFEDEVPELMELAPGA